MRRAISAALAALMISAAVPAQSATGVELFLKVPWSLGIHVYQWMTREQKRVLYVEVMAEGENLEAARQSALRMAVERAVGVIVSSETEVQNQRIRRDDIITYASGFVHDYRLVDQTQRGSRTWVKMQVWVSHSSLRDRLLNESRDAARVEGGRISQQIESFQHSRQSGDRVLASVLQDFPQRAFDISVEPTRVVVDAQRNTFLQVSFVMSWNSHYITSLQEAVSTINQRKDCGGWFNRCQNLEAVISVGGTTGYFDDRAAFDLMHRHTLISQPMVEISILDTQNRPVVRECWDFQPLSQSQYTNAPFVDLGGNRVIITPGTRNRADVFVPLTNLPVRNLDRVDVRAVRAADCPQARR